MLRFIFRQKKKDNISGYEGECFLTYEIDVREIEEILSYGGYGENGYIKNELVGIEVISQRSNQ